MILKDDQRLYYELFEAPLKDAPGKKKLNVVKLPPLEGIKLSKCPDDQLYRLLFGSEPPQIQRRVLPPPPAHEQPTAATGPEATVQSAQGNGTATSAAGPVPATRRVLRPKANGSVPERDATFPADGHFMQQQQEEEEDDFDIAFDELDVAAQPVPAAAPRISEPQHPPTATAPPTGVAVQRPPPGAPPAAGAPAVQPPRPPPGNPPPPAGPKNSSAGGAPPAARSGSAVAVPGLGVTASGIAGLGIFKPTSTDTLKPGQPGAAPPPAPPGAQRIGGPPVAAGYGRSQYINVNTGLPTFVGLESQAVFPSQDTGEGPLKLPKQTRVTPEEYKEFLSLGHGEIFTVDLDRVIDAPWRLPNANLSDFFNYGLNERTWREYCQKVQKYRQEFTLKNQITTFDDGNKPGGPAGRGNAAGSATEADGPGISADIAAVINRAAAASAAAATATAIPVFVDPEEEGPAGGRGGAGPQEDFRAKTTEWRRHKARLDPEAVIELSAPEGPLTRNNFPNTEYEQPAELQERDRDRFLTREDVEVMREARQRPQAPLPAAPYVPSIAELYELYSHLKPKPPSLPPPPGLSSPSRPPSRGPATGDGATAADNQSIALRGPRPPPGSPPKGDISGNAADMPPLAMPSIQMPSIMGMSGTTNESNSNHNLGMMQMPPVMGMMMGMNMTPGGVGMMPSITPGNAGMGMMMGRLGSVLSPRQGGNLDDSMRQDEGQNEQLHAVQSHGFMDDIALESVHDNSNDNYFFAGDTTGGDYHHDDVDHRDGDDAGFYGEDAEGGGGGWTGPDTHPSAVFDLLGAGFGGQDDYQPEQDYDNPDENMGAAGRRPSGALPPFRGRPMPYDRLPGPDRYRPRSRSPPRGGRSPARSPVRSRGDRDRSDRDRVRDKDRERERDRKDDKDKKSKDKDKEARVSKDKEKSSRRSKSPVKRGSSPVRKAKHRSRSRSKERHKSDDKKKESRGKR